MASQVEAERFIAVNPIRSAAASTAPLATSALPLATETMLRRLATSMYVELRTVQCQFSRGVLTLTGLVPTFYLKQVITSLAENIEGVSQINNQVEVIDFRARRSMSA